MTSAYAVCAAIVYFNLAMLVVALLARRTSFLVKYSTSLLLLFAVLGVLRMLVPLDLREACVIESYTAYPAVRDALRSPLPLSGVSITTGELLLLVWLAGTVTVLLKKALQLLREHRALARLPRVESPAVRAAAARLDLQNAEIVVSPQVCVPMSAGLFRAHIYLPDIALPEEEWTLILAHEYQHIRSHDTLIRLFYLLLLALFWWNPVVYWFQKTLDQLLELRCDANVTKDMDEGEKERYLAAILDVVRKLRGSGLARPAAASALVYRHPSSTVQRFDVVLNGRKKSEKVQAALSALAVCVFLLSYFVILQPCTAPPADTVSITPENAYILIPVYEEK